MTHNWFPLCFTNLCKISTLSRTKNHTKSLISSTIQVSRLWQCVIKIVKQVPPSLPSFQQGEHFRFFVLDRVDILQRFVKQRGDQLCVTCSLPWVMKSKFVWLQFYCFQIIIDTEVSYHDICTLVKNMNVWQKCYEYECDKSVMNKLERVGFSSMAYVM